MIKYLKYFISPLTLFLSIYICSMGNYYPTIFLVTFSLIVILGDIFLGENNFVEEYKFPKILNVALYVNLPLLFGLIFLFFIVFGNLHQIWINNILLRVPC